jgi:hypothetical protein
LHMRPRVQRAPGLPCALFLFGAELVARLDRATQYSRAPMMNTNALEYWVTRFRG